MQDRDGKGGKGPSEVLFEFIQVGQQMRVVAIDVATQTEVIAIAPVSATRGQMQALAMAKLRRRMADLPGTAPRRLF